MSDRPFVDAWRRKKSAAFDLGATSTAGRAIALELWGQRRSVYANANLSIYSAQRCNAACAFCVEELRPASRGLALAHQKRLEADDGRYFAALDACLHALGPLHPSASVTGGEPSKDPRLPRILQHLAAAGVRKRTVTTNASGLLDRREGARVIDWLARTEVAHLNISRAHPDHDRNAHLMRYREGPSVSDLQTVVEVARAAGIRVRLSCVLVRGAVDDLAGIERYLQLARSLGIDNVIFRQLMGTDPRTVERNYVVRYCDRSRALLEPILDAISGDPRWAFQRQIVGYYYYVEVWRHDGIDVVFEEADLAELERKKRADPETIHELVFHPDATLASTWQPWDGRLGPGATARP